MYRQGDILFKPVEWRKDEWNGLGTITRNRYGKKKRDIIVAAGEATGHHHRVSDKHVRRIRRDTQDVLLVSKHGTTVTHEEHAGLQLPPGAYEIVRQREYTPNPVQERAWSYVQD